MYDLLRDLLFLFFPRLSLLTHTAVQLIRGVGGQLLHDALKRILREFFPPDRTPLLGEQPAQQLQLVGDRRCGSAHRHRLGLIPEIDEQPTDRLDVGVLGRQQLLELAKVPGYGLQTGIPGGLELLLPAVDLRDRPLDVDLPDPLPQHRRGGIEVLVSYTMLRHFSSSFFDFDKKAPGRYPEATSSMCLWRLSGPYELPFSVRRPLLLLLGPPGLLFPLLTQLLFPLPAGFLFFAVSVEVAHGHHLLRRVLYFTVRHTRTAGGRNIGGPLVWYVLGCPVDAHDGSRKKEERDAQPAGARDEPLPVAAQEQPRRLVSLGRGGPGEGEGRGQTHLA